MSLELEVLEELTLLTIRTLLLGDKEFINGFFSLKTNQTSNDVENAFQKSASECQINQNLLDPEKNINYYNLDTRLCGLRNQKDSNSSRTV